MLTVKKLRRKPKHFHNFTGLTPEQFDRLLVASKPLYEQAEEKTPLQSEAPASQGRRAQLQPGAA